MNYIYTHPLTSERYISHHGILGQKWGVRRFQNKDGTLTEAGKKRRNSSDYTEIERRNRAQKALKIAGIATASVAAIAAASYAGYSIGKNKGIEAMKIAGQLKYSKVLTENNKLKEELSNAARNLANKEHDRAIYQAQSSKYSSNLSKALSITSNIVDAYSKGDYDKVAKNTTRFEDLLDLIGY